MTTKDMLITAFVSLKEGGKWEVWEPDKFDTIHAIKFADGRIWDTRNGWREDRHMESKKPRQDLHVLGRKLGTHTGWDSDGEFNLAFFNFEPAEGIQLKAGDIYVDLEHGLIGEAYAPEWIPCNQVDLIDFLSKIPRDPTQPTG